MSVQQQKLTEIADAIRAKKGSTDPIAANDFASEITNLPSGGSGGMIDDFYKEQSEGYYQQQTTDIIEARRIWDEIGIDTANDANYDKIANSVYKSKIKYIPKLTTEWPSASYVGGLSGFSSLVTVPEITIAMEGARYFQDCSLLSYIPKLNILWAMVLEQLFYNCSSLVSTPPIDMTGVTAANGMFQGCTNLKNVGDIDTSRLTSISSFFNNCSSLVKAPLLKCDNCFYLESTFYGCKNLEEIHLENTKGVNSFRMMFPMTALSNLKIVKTLDLTNWDGTNTFFFDAAGNNQPPWLCHTLLFVPESIKKSLYFHKCTGLSQESLNSIVAGLANVTTAQTVTFASVHNVTSSQEVKLTEAQITEMQGKGWTVAFQ